LPLPDGTAHLWSNLTLAAEFAFWGIWWPFVLLSMVLFGRLWCGVLCPEGTLTEWASKHGRGLGIPRWMRWGGWPFVAFVCTTVYGQMVSVYQYPKAAMVVLGGSTVAAIVVGYFYTRGKRAWCRYLCPVNGVFGLLSKLAPMHYRTQEVAWRQSLDTDAAQRRVFTLHPAKPKAVDCAPMLDLRRLDGTSDCHMCGRCSKHHDAIAMQWRSPSEEIVTLAATKANYWQTALIVYGLLGVAIGAFHWSASPWYVTAKQWLATWLVDHDILWPLASNAPWWILTNYPDQNDTFNWLDGALLISYIGATAIVWGSVTLMGLACAVRLAGTWRTQRMHHLAQALIPVAGIGVFLGLSSTTLALLRAEGLALPWINDLRLTLLMGANIWALWLAWQIARTWALNVPRALLCILPFLAVLVWNDTAWAWLFWWW
jgi:polyferredoxin